MRISVKYFARGISFEVRVEDDERNVSSDRRLWLSTGPRSHFAENFSTVTFNKQSVLDPRSICEEIILMFFLSRVS